LPTVVGKSTWGSAESSSTFLIILGDVTSTSGEKLFRLFLFFEGATWTSSELAESSRSSLNHLYECFFLNFSPEAVYFSPLGPQLQQD
jgi:hypothetical protein